MKKYAIDFEKDSLYFAASKARKDIDNIIIEDSFENIILFKKYKSKIMKFISLFVNFTKIMLKKFDNNEENLFLFQYPYVLNSCFLSNLVVNVLRKKLKYSKIQFKIICLIHDLEYFRYGIETQNETEFLKKDIKILNNFDYVISHNSSMTKLLNDNKIESKIYNLNLFDYLVKNDINEKEINKNKYVVCFAGNLSNEKSSFLYEIVKYNIDMKFQLELYGVNFDEKYLNNSNFKYKGSFNPDELPENIKADFGLIWDGTSIETCSGTLGKYMQYNNPHKFSLYMAMKLPVIAWKDSAIAKFVELNNIGIVIDSLNNLGETLDKIDSEKYKSMKNNVRKISSNVVRGYYTKNTLLEIYNDINKK